jgi:hypothetical protein
VAFEHGTSRAAVSSKGGNMSKYSSLTSRAGLALLLLLAVAAPVKAFNQYDYLFDPGAVRNDTQLFLNLMVTDSGVVRGTLEPVLPRIRYVESDLPVILLLSHQTGRPVGSIVDLRARGLSWAQVFNDLGLRYDPLFAGFDQDPGARYRTVWTTWRTTPTRLRLTDSQVRDLAQVQFGHRLARVPVVEVTRAYALGQSPVAFVANKHGRTYTRVGVPPGHGGVPPGHGGVPPGQVKNGVPPGHRQAAVATEKKDKEDKKDKKDDQGGRGQGNEGKKGKQ